MRLIYDQRIEFVGTRDLSQKLIGGNHNPFGESLGRLFAVGDDSDGGLILASPPFVNLPLPTLPYDGGTYH
jgi:hypothetical protein